MKTRQLASVEIIRTDGRRETHEVGRHILLPWILRMIGANVSDIVNLRDGRVMIVDDNGYEVTEEKTSRGITLKPVRALKPVNEAATMIYHGVCRPGTTHQIVGDVAIAWDEDFA